VGLSNYLSGDPTATGITDGIYFLHDASNVLTANTEDAATTSTTLDTTLALNTYVELGFTWDLTSVVFYVDGVRVAEHTTVANIPLSVAMVPFFAARQQAGAALAFYIDWIKFVQFR